MTFDESISDTTLAEKFDLFSLSDDYFDAPHIWHRRLREHDPIHRNSDGTVLLTRYADVRQVWRDSTATVDKTELFQAKFGEGPLLEHHTTAMLFRDPPDHDRLRAIVQPFFALDSVRQFENFLETLTDQIVDEVLEMETFDVVTDLAAKIPVSIITRIIGVPLEDGDYIRRLGQQVIFPLNPQVPPEAIQCGHQAVAEFVAYLTQQLAAVRRHWDGTSPRTLLEAMVGAERSGGEISESEMVHMCILTLNGGHETTTNLIAGSLHALLEHPTQLEELRQGGEEIRHSAVQELSRYVSPLQLQGRRLTQDTRLPSGDLPAGTEVILCQASANRDPAVFQNPDRLDLRREPNTHLAFGLGLHRCVGRVLAGIEAWTVVSRAVQRLPGLERAGTPEVNKNVRFRGFKSLPVTTRA
jgi:cytochrome P450